MVKPESSSLFELPRIDSGRAETHSSRVRAFFDSDTYLAGNALIPIRARLVQDLLPNVRDARILDLGCGNGEVSRPLLTAGNRLTLVDFSAAMLDRARCSMPPGAPVEFVEADISNYQGSALFDVVICVGVLAHVPSPLGAVSRLAQLVRLGGLCLVQITDNDAPLGWLLNQYYKWRQPGGWQLNVMTRRQITLAATKRGLQEIGSRRYGLTLPGSGRVPYWLTQRMEAAAAKRPLSPLGAQLLMLFRRERSREMSH